MAKIAILSIDKKTGAVKATITNCTGDKEAAKTIKAAGTYAFIEVHEIDPKKDKG